MENAGLTVIPKQTSYVATSLVQLFLANNAISTLNNMYGIPFPNLKSVYLSFNNISCLNHGLLRLPALQTFRIIYNKLTHLADMRFCVWGMAIEGATSSLFQADNNTWHCDGSMEWLQKSMCQTWGEISYKRMKLEIPLGGLFCHSPTELQGEPVVPVDKLDYEEMELCGEFYNDWHDDIIMTLITQLWTGDTTFW